MLHFISLRQCNGNGIKEPIVCKKNTMNWSQKSVPGLARRSPYRVISTSTQKHTSFIQDGEDLCGSRVSLETSHTGDIGDWPDPDLPRHRAGAHHRRGWEGQTSHWWLVATQGLRGRTETHIHRTFQILRHSRFWLYYLCDTQFIQESILNY